MGLEIRVGYNDHRKVEDFLGTRPAAVDAIHVEAKFLRRHQTAIDVARQVGVQVVIESLTELLFEDGFPTALSYAPDRKLDVASLARDANQRHDLVQPVISAQVGRATILVPPFTCVTDEMSLQLNLALTTEVVEDYCPEHQVRPVLLAQRSYLADRSTRATMVAHRYLDAGVAAIELRLTPVNPEHMSLAQVRSVLDVCAAMQAAGLTVTLGHQGALGRAGFALGLASGFVLGVGMSENTDHAAKISRQLKPPALGSGGVAQPGVYLPQLGLTLPRARGRELLQLPRLRTRLACRLGHCRSDLLGPTSDVRAHYLHTRAHEVSELLAQPPAWRANSELTRARQALELREMINDHFLSSSDNPLPTRGLQALISHLEGPQQDNQAVG